MRLTRFGVLMALTILVIPPAFGGEGELDPLLEKLRNGDVKAKQRLIDAGAPAIKPLFGLLTEKDGRLAWEARSALRRISIRAADHPERRKAVLDAVVPYLDAKHLPLVRRVAVELLAFVGTDGQVPALTEMLGDKRLFESAAGALCRIWGQAGKSALIEALATRRPAAEARFLLELIASHGEADTLPLFVQAAKVPNEGVRIAAVEAIGRLGQPKGTLTLVETLRRGSAKVRAAAFESLLTLAGARLRAKNPRAARAIFERALELARTDERQAAALVGLGRVGEPAALPAITGRLKARSPRVRHAAYAALCQVRGPAGLQAIAEALPEAPKEFKPILIEALGARKDPTTARLLVAAAKERDEAVAVAAVRALRELGAPAAASDLLDLADNRRTPDAVRAAAVRAAIDLGHVLADREQGPAALAILDRAFKLAANDADRREALLGMGKAAEPKAVVTLAAVIAKKDDSSVRAAALEACIAIADAADARGDRANAIAAYSSVADAGPANALALEAIKKLTRLGVHYKLADRNGFLTTWWMIGPFPCRDFRAAKQAWFPEREIHLKKAYQVEGRRLRWRLEHSRHRKGWVVLNNRFKPNNKVLAYCYTELTSEGEQDIQFIFGRDDGLTLWLNGQALYDVHNRHGAADEEFALQARLAKGINRILVKSSEGRANWEFYLRITDPQGKPLRSPARRQ